MTDAEDDKTQILSRPPQGVKPAGPVGMLRCVDTSVLKDDSGGVIELDGEEVSVGRGEENAVVLNAHGISRNHARVYLEAGAWQVEDLGSTNGTRVNNSKVERCALNDGDTVAFGRVCYKLSLHERGAAPGAASVMDIDLGAGDKTMIMRPAQRASIPEPGPTPKAPGAEQIYESGKHRGADVQAAMNTGGGRTGLLIGLVVAALVLAGVAAWLLGVF